MDNILQTRDEKEFEVELAKVEYERMYSMSESEDNSHFPDSPSFEDMLNAYDSAVKFQNERGISSKEPEWNNQEFLQQLKKSEPDSYEYFKKLEELDRAYVQTVDDVSKWSQDMSQNTQKEKFFKLLDDIDLHQLEPRRELDMEILKETFTNDRENHVIFQLDFNDDEYGERTGLGDARNIIFDAVYKNGTIHTLTPEHDKLFNHLKDNERYPDNILTQSDKSWIMSISNEVITDISEYRQLVSELSKDGTNELRSHEVELSEAIQKRDPVERLKALQSLGASVEKTFEKINRMAELIRVLKPTLEPLQETFKSKDTISQDFQNIYSELRYPELLKNGKIASFQTMRDVVKRIPSIDFQEIRKDGYASLDRLYKNSEQATLVKIFDDSKPFKFDVTSTESNYKGTMSFIKELQSNVIQEPKAIVAHYLSIQESIQTYNEVNRYSTVDMLELTEYSREALKEAVKVIHDELAKDYPSYSKITSKPFESEIELAELLKPIPKLPLDKEISILNIANSEKLTDKQKDFWNQNARAMIEDYTEREIKVDNLSKVILGVNEAKDYLQKSIESIQKYGGDLRIEEKMLEQLNKWQQKEQVQSKENEKVKSQESDMER